MTGRKVGVSITIVLVLSLTACTPPPSTSSQATSNQGINVTTTTQSVSSRLMSEAQQFAYRVRNVNCDATGSSFATGQGIITNRHVASGSQTLQLSTWSGDDFTASLQSISEPPGPDLAIIDGGSSQKPAVLTTGNVAPGTQVWAAGYPEGDELALTPGIVIDYISGSTYGVSGQIMELTNPIKPGNSGSPLLDSDGNVVGVVFALNTVTGNGLAIPIATLSQYLNSPGSDTFGGCDG